MLYEKKKWRYILIFLIPFAIFTIIFIFYPAFVNILNTFRDYKNGGVGNVYANFLEGNYIWCGIDNIKNVFTNTHFLRSIGNTFILVAFVIVFQVGLALLFALLVNSIKKFANLYRVIFFMPIVLSGVALGTIYRMMIMPEGLFTAIFGIKDWLPANNFRALFMVMIPIIWQYVGFYFVIMLTGLAGIPDDVNEAARLDGASGLQMTWFITLPMLWNVFRTCMVLAITGALKVFDFPHSVAYNGAPGGQTFFMGTFNYNLFENTKYGQTSFYSLLIVFVGMFVSLVCNMLIKENKDIQGG